ncbi:MAG: hypothetical protein ACSLE2_12820 [Lysobacterales bacterium]
MNGARITNHVSGEVLELTPFECQRGKRLLAKRLGELRQCNPAHFVVTDFGNLPMAQVEVLMRGNKTALLVDPLDIWQRLGLPRELPEWMQELDADESGWIEC